MKTVAPPFGNVELWELAWGVPPYPNHMGVVDPLEEGPDLTGQVPTTGFFEAPFKPSVLTPEQLSERAGE